MFFAQRHIIYKPSGELSRPSAYGLSEFKEMEFSMSDQNRIRAWYKPAKDKQKTLIYIHGNAGNLGDRANLYQAFSSILDLGIMAITYRGYPGSNGKPSEAKIYQDFAEILTFIEQKYDIKPRDLVLYGSSLGSGVAVEIASNNDIHALILESPFTNLADIAKLNYWYLPVNLLLQDRFDSISKAPEVTAPTFIIHSGDDDIIPPKYGKELYEAFHYPKKFFLYPGAQHVDLNYKLVAYKMNIFLNKLKRRYSNSPLK